MSQSGVYGSGGGGGGAVDTLSGNTGGAISPDGLNNINVVGTGIITVSGNAGTNTLTISSSSQNFSWTDVPSSATVSVDNGYFVNNGVTITLPGSPSQGNEIQIVCVTGIITIQANTGQYIQLSNVTSNITGTAVNTLSGDAIDLVYQNASSTWFARNFNGSWTVS